MELPTAVRTLATAVAAAVGAAQAADAEAYGAAVTKLETLDTHHVGLVLGHVIRTLLEEGHADGLSSEDIRDALSGCVTRTIGWWPGVDPQALLTVLVGALGVHPTDEEAPALAGLAVVGHAPLLAADLLGNRPVTPYLAAALAEIARSEAMD